jgi:hypothetical protein
MNLLLISPNPLLEELILDLIADCEGFDVVLSEPCNAHETISKSKPEVIILDQSIDEKTLDKIFNYARALNNTRTVLVDPGSNDFVIVDSRRSKLRNVEDLIQAIQGLDVAHS